MKIQNIPVNIQSLILSHISISVVLLWIIFELDLFLEPVPILGYSILSFIVFTKLLKHEWSTNYDIGIEIVYLIGCFFRFVLPSFGFFYTVILHDKIEYFDSDVTEFAFPTIVWMNIMHIIMFTIFKIRSQGYSFGRILRDFLSKKDVFYWLVALYVILIPVRFYGVIFSVVQRTQFLENIIDNIVNAILIVLAFSAAFRFNHRRHVFLIFICAINFLLASILSFYKFNMLVPILTYIIFFILHQREERKPIITHKSIVLVLGVLTFVSVVVFPFMTAKRIVAGFTVETNSATVDYTLFDIVDVMYDADINEIVSSNTLFDRQDAVPVNAFYYQDVQKKNEYHPELLIKSVLISIPRIIYPDKPYNNIGMMATEYAQTGVINDKSVTSCYTYVGFLGGSYFWGGAWGSVICAVLSGFFLALYNIFLLRRIYNPIALLSYLVFLLTAISAFEETHDGGIGRLFSFIPVVILIKITSFFFSRNK